MSILTLHDVQQARETIKDIVKKTDLLESVKLSKRLGQTYTINVRTYKKQVHSKLGELVTR